MNLVIMWLNLKTSFKYCCFCERQGKGNPVKFRSGVATVIGQALYKVKAGHWDENSEKVYRACDA